MRDFYFVQLNIVVSLTCTVVVASAKNARVPAKLQGEKRRSPTRRNNPIFYQTVQQTMFIFERNFCTHHNPLSKQKMQE